MKYIVFESGSRAGFSAEMFFRHYKKHTKSKDELILVDDDEKVNLLNIYPEREDISRVKSNAVKYDEKTQVFPADELTRQRNYTFINKYCQDSSKVYPEYFDKKGINQKLSKICKENVFELKIPKTFELNKVFVKPNSESAGSKGLMSYDNVCVSQDIDIKDEFVIDVLRDDNRIELYPRQVILKNGYDRFIKLLDESSEVYRVSKQFISAVCPENKGMFSGVFHLQLAKSKDGSYYFIEWSKRISGTSLVNIAVGMNPFLFLNGVKTKKKESNFKIGEWYRYEDFILSLNNL